MLIFSGPLIFSLGWSGCPVKNGDKPSFLLRQNIHSLRLAPCTAHFMLPTNRTFFEYSQSAFNEVCLIWIRIYSGTNTMMRTFGKVYAEAWRTSAFRKGISGFRTCGMCPANKHLVPKAAIVPSKASGISSSHQHFYNT